jgi:hypothetical protein
MPDEAYNIHHSVTRKERAEALAVKQAESDYRHSAAGQEIEKLKADLQALKDYVHQLRGEEGIENEGPIFRLTNPRRDMGGAGLTPEKVDLTFCDDNDVQHTGTFWLEPGSIVPPL